MDWVIILQAGIASGTVLLFATIGEVLAERSGILNLGLEGMMLIGAMSAYSVAVNVGSPWLGLVVGMATAGLLALLHGFVTIHLQADQVVSGLSLTFLGTGLSMVFGEGLSQAGAIALLPRFTIPALSAIPFLGDILFTDQSIMVYLGYLLALAAWLLYRRQKPVAWLPPLPVIVLLAVCFISIFDWARLFDYSQMEADGMRSLTELAQYVEILLLAWLFFRELFCDRRLRRG